MPGIASLTSFASLAPLTSLSPLASLTSLPPLASLASFDSLASFNSLASFGVGGATMLAAASSTLAVGVLGLFGGGDDEADLSGIARRLDAPEDPHRIERRLDALEDAIDALVADADLDRHASDSPAADASSVEKAEALAQAVRGGRLSVAPESASGRASSDDGAVTSAATRLRRERSPSSPAAGRLLDLLASPERTDPAEIEETIERGVTALDTQHALERALADVDADGLAQGDARRVRDRLSHPDNDATAGVRRLARAAEAHHETAERHETEQETVADATDKLTEAATSATDFDVGPNSDRSMGERLRLLGDAVERDELAFTEEGGDGGPVASAASQVRRSRNPQSTVAKRLLDRLSSPSMGDVEAALDTAVEQLDAASTTESVVADLDRESVRRLADDVASRCDENAGPLADVVAERVEKLRETLARADESNAVIPYAVRNELRFYDRTLLGQLDGSRAGASGSSGDPGASIDAVTDRREEVENQYVDGRRDHNHSIPLHFLSLVDALCEEAERAASSGDADRAAGLSSAADQALDYVEQLYERNEYSVMLRRLRG